MMSINLGFRDFSKVTKDTEKNKKPIPSFEDLPREFQIEQVMEWGYENEEMDFETMYEKLHE